MKNSLILALVSICFLLISFKGAAQGKLTFEEAKQQIESHFKVQLHCPEQYIPSDIPDLPTFENLSLEDVLDKLLGASILSYFSYDDKNVVLGPKNIVNSNEFKTILKAKEEAAVATIEIENFKIGDPTKDPNKSQYSIKANVIDDNVKDPLIGVTVSVEGTNQASITDEIGNIEFLLEKGQYNFVLNYIGYLEKVIKVEVLGDGKVEILLSKEAYQLDQVTISADAGENSVSRGEIGLEALGAKDIQKLPSLMGEADVIKTLLLLPGVSTVGEGASGVNIRGGSVDQNLILQDGIPLFNASHVLGLFSLFNPDVVKSIELYKGSMPARYGGKVSSIMDVELKDGNYNKFKGRGGIGLISSRVTLEGPIIEEKLSFIAGGRFSFSDWIFQSIREAAISNSKANFYDGNLKLSSRIGKKGKLVLSGYTSFDRFKYDDNFDFNWNSNALSLNFNYVIKPRVSFALKSSYSTYESELVDPVIGRSFSYKNGINNFKFKPYIQLDNIFGFNSYIGIEANYYQIQSGDISPLDSESSIEPFRLNGQQGLESAAYIDVEKQITPWLQFNIGVRYNNFINLGPQTVAEYEAGTEKTSETRTTLTEIGENQIIKSFNGLSPRSSLKIQTGANSSVKMSYNITRQYLSQLFNTTAVTPVDLWQMSNTHIDPIYAENYSIGFFFGLSDNKWENSAEIFYRDIDNIIEYKDLADLFLNEFIETEIVSATGRAYGLELSIKKNVGRLTGRVSYTLSRTESKTDGEFPKEKINNNQWFSSNYDRPHDLSLTSSFQFTKRTYASANFVYSSGRPTSAPTGNITVGNAVNIPIYGARNNFRIPSYHRLDVSYTIEQSHKKTQKWRSSWTFSVYNLYGRKNAFSVFFTQKPFQSPEANRLAVLARPIPSLTYNFNF